MSLRFTPRARDDISDIYDFIAQHNPRAARAVVRRIRATCRLLAQYPGIGRETALAGVRMQMVYKYPYLVYYALMSDGTGRARARAQWRADKTPHNSDSPMPLAYRHPDEGRDPCSPLQ
jgi:toxin ParE1/3/4